MQSSQARAAANPAGIHRVLVALDGSDCALRALSAAVERSREVGNTVLHLLTVHWPPDELETSATWRQRQRTQRFATLRTDWVLRQAEQHIPTAGPRYVKETLHGEPAKIIVQRAGQLRCEVIFVGAHGTRTATSNDVGSVAAQICALSIIPVRVVK